MDQIQAKFSLGVKVEPKDDCVLTLKSNKLNIKQKEKQQNFLITNKCQLEKTEDGIISIQSNSNEILNILIPNSKERKTFQTRIQDLIRKSKSKNQQKKKKPKSTKSTKSNPLKEKYLKLGYYDVSFSIFDLKLDKGKKSKGLIKLKKYGFHIIKQLKHSITISIGDTTRFLRKIENGFIIRINNNQNLIVFFNDNKTSPVFLKEFENIYLNFKRTLKESQESKLELKKRNKERKIRLEKERKNRLYLKKKQWREKENELIIEEEKQFNLKFDTQEHKKYYEKGYLKVKVKIGSKSNPTKCAFLIVVNSEIKFITKDSILKYPYSPSLKILNKQQKKVLICLSKSVKAVITFHSNQYLSLFVNKIESVIEQLQSEREMEIKIENKKKKKKGKVKFKANIELIEKAENNKNMIIELNEKEIIISIETKDKDPMIYTKFELIKRESEKSINNLTIFSLLKTQSMLIFDSSGNSKLIKFESKKKLKSFCKKYIKFLSKILSLPLENNLKAKYNTELSKKWDKKFNFKSHIVRGNENLKCVIYFKSRSYCIWSKTKGERFEIMGKYLQSNQILPSVTQGMKQIALNVRPNKWRILTFSSREKGYSFNSKFQSMKKRDNLTKLCKNNNQLFSVIFKPVVKKSNQNENENENENEIQKEDDQKEMKIDNDEKEKDEKLDKNEIKKNENEKNDNENEKDKKNENEGNEDEGKKKRKKGNNEKKNKTINQKKIKGELFLHQQKIYLKVFFERKINIGQVCLKKFPINGKILKKIPNSNKKINSQLYLKKWVNGVDILFKKAEDLESFINLWKSFDGIIEEN
ncbi:transcription initiation factor tfiid subunit 3 [Anaeramoeba flamelloides]|uniref:Transcription initiation factor tfiid subunit 3 n=1 Tax=Anaeramoeba flamelloides TaxID=1746091 RepID=A0ABQ8X9D3_9EUKA|nr:transcription initiation factor tfiid subunit 3 [Anaeramoeba flamelloides]